jgi:hypothetical protein
LQCYVTARQGIYIHYIVKTYRIVTLHIITKHARIRRAHDRMMVGFTTTYAIGDYRHYRCEFESGSGEVYWIQHYVIKFVK